MKLFTTKFIMCALVVGPLVGVADAAQVIVFEAPLDDWNQKVSADFAANRELGRAWIEGECLVVPRIEQRKMDDGFNIRERTVAKVIFEAQTSSASQPAAASKQLTGETVGK